MQEGNRLIVGELGVIPQGKFLKAIFCLLFCGQPKKDVGCGTKPANLIFILRFKEIKPPILNTVGIQKADSEYPESALFVKLVKQSESIPE